MALECLLDRSPGPPAPEELYKRLRFRDAPPDRPFVYINMVSTVDGKIVIGESGGPAKGVGGPTDQKLFRRLQKVCDAALIGSTTLRASQVIYPAETARFVVTRSGEVPLGNRFFSDAPDSAYIVAPQDLDPRRLAVLQSAANVLKFGVGGVDLRQLLRYLREQLGINVLLCEGGASLNDELLRAGLVDELFLTLAPKLKGGAHLPTIVTGQGFPPHEFQPLDLISLYRDGSELYLRYRLS